MIDSLRNATNGASRHGVNEVKLRNGRIVREGLHTSLTELRLRKNSPSARKRWASICSCPSVFVIGRDRAKLGFFWRHAYQIARSGRYQGSLVNPDSGEPVFLGEDGERLLAIDFKKAKLSEVLGRAEGANHARRPLYSPLWQADGSKTRRFAPIEFIGRHMPGFFDYAIGDEVHELKGGDTAQGNALGACRRYGVWNLLFCYPLSSESRTPTFLLLQGCPRSDFCGPGRPGQAWSRPLWAPS